MIVSQRYFSAFWRPENAISAYSSTGLIRSMIFGIILMGLEISVNNLILYIFVLGLEISAKTTSFSM
jgi:hypothetical protein